MPTASPTKTLTTADVVVLSPPGGGTRRLARAAADTAAEIESGTVMAVPCVDADARHDIATWCLSAGHRIVNPFDHWCVDHLLVRVG